MNHALSLDAFRAEWKWDGIRVQVITVDGEKRLYSRAGEDIGKSFPDILEAMTFDAVLDGELLMARQAGSAIEIASVNDLQQRLNCRTVTGRAPTDWPAHVRLYDILREGAIDTRPLAFDLSRARLEAWYQAQSRPRFDLSPLIPFQDWAKLAAIHTGARAASIEGLMLKRADSLYLGGRVKGRWFKWKRDPLTVDAVLMYAQRGHGKRSSFYSD